MDDKWEEKCSRILGQDWIVFSDTSEYVYELFFEVKATESYNVTAVNLACSLSTEKFII